MFKYFATYTCECNWSIICFAKLEFSFLKIVTTEAFFNLTVVYQNHGEVAKISERIRAISAKRVFFSCMECYLGPKLCWV